METQRNTVVCLHRKNHPRLFVAVCENCRLSGKCPEYQQYLNSTCPQVIKNSGEGAKIIEH
jgi:hypothetical protein